MHECFFFVSRFLNWNPRGELTVWSCVPVPASGQQLEKVSGPSEAALPSSSLLQLYCFTTGTLCSHPPSVIKPFISLSICTYDLSRSKTGWILALYRTSVVYRLQPLNALTHISIFFFLLPHINMETRSVWCQLRSSQAVHRFAL